jgi:hypothetical protein
MKLHGNNNKNDLLHHLYVIDDLQEKEVFKFGISDDPIEEDGLSKRARDQQDYLNLVVGIFRFIARILIRNISTREEAKRIEDKHMEEFEEKYGRLPRGNRKKNKKNR